MHALLLIAHGSRRAASNDEVRRLADRLRLETGSGFDLVVPAFLELAEPDIVTGVAACVESGATAITVVPYFLSAGRHVVEDIPNQLERATDRFPGTEIRVAEHVGMHSRMPGLILNAAQAV